MKKLIIYLYSILFSIYSYSNCITEREYNKISNRLNLTKDDPYSSIPNIINCNKNSRLNNLVCHDSKLVAAFQYLSIGRIYAYENATHTPVDNYSTYNNDYIDWLNNLIKNEKDNQIALRKLCYVMKEDTEVSYGGDLHYAPPKFHEVISSKENENGIIINSLQRIIYLGKNCDVQTSDKVTGHWYKKSEQFVIQLDNREHLKVDPKPIIFNMDEKIAKAMEKLNCKK